MKRLLLTLILIGVIYVLVRMVMSGITTYTQNATLVLSGMRNDVIHDIVRTHYNNRILPNDAILPEDAKFVLTPAHLNTDNEIDIIARVESAATCGGGGCITTLFIRSEDGLLTPVSSFAYAIKEIKVLASITSGMHDIRLNKSVTATLIWDGNQYTINSL